MIKSFKHKGIEIFYCTGSKKGIKPEHAPKWGRILDRLDAAQNVQDMNLPGYNLHKLTGKRKETWSVWVSGNWRVTFYFEAGDVYIVDYLDYH